MTGQVMRRNHIAAVALVTLLAGCAAGRVHAEPPTPIAPIAPQVPQVGAPCPEQLADAMTLLPDATTYVACRQQAGGYTWADVQTPFDPSDTWVTYGPAVTLHGQGMRNPNLTSGQWTATPLDPESDCRASQQTVIEAGVLSDPQVFEGEKGKALTLPMLPKLFYAELSGNCLWVRD